MILDILKSDEKKEYIEFLVQNFAENADEKSLRVAAEKEIDCMFSDYFRKPIFYCYREHGKLVATSGIIREWVAPNTYSIFWVCVDSNRRGEGIGTQIMNVTTQKLAEEVLSNQAGTLMLYCLPHNCAFYETLGYEKGPAGHKFIFMSQALNTDNA